MCIRDSYGIYVEDEMAIGESTLLTLGARYDKWKAYDGYISKQSGTVKATDFYDSRDVYKRQAINISLLRTANCKASIWNVFGDC